MATKKTQTAKNLAPVAEEVPPKNGLNVQQPAVVSKKYEIG